MLFSVPWTSPTGWWNTSLHSPLSHSCLFPWVCLFPHLSSWANPPPLLFYYVTYHVFYCIYLTKKTTRLFWHNLSHDSPLLLSLCLLTEFLSKLFRASETELMDMWLPRLFFLLYITSNRFFFSSHIAALRSKGFVEYPCFKTCRVSYQKFSVRNGDFFAPSCESTSPLGSPSASVAITFTPCYYPCLFPNGDF